MKAKFRRLFAWLMILLFTGCSALTGSSPGARIPADQTVAILAIDRIPDVRIDGFSASRLQGFASGAENTFVACFRSFGQGACLNSGCGALVLFLLGTCGTLGVVGGIVGAFDAESGEQLAAGNIGRALNTAPAQGQLRDRIVIEARRRSANLSTLELDSAPGAEPDYRVAGSFGVDTVLAVELTRVGTAGPGGSAPARLYMEARARLIRVADGAQLSTADYRVDGQSFSARQWQANRGALLLSGFEQAYAGLAEKIYLGTFR